MMRRVLEDYLAFIQFKEVIYIILVNIFPWLTIFLSSRSKWPYFAALPPGSFFRIFAIFSSEVKAEDFADTSSPTSLLLFPVTYDFEINAALEYTPPFNKHCIGNAKNLINAAAFNRVNTIVVKLALVIVHPGQHRLMSFVLQVDTGSLLFYVQLDEYTTCSTQKNNKEWIRKTRHFVCGYWLERHSSQPVEPISFHFP